jgi:hypothetical protein
MYFNKYFVANSAVITRNILGWYCLNVCADIKEDIIVIQSSYSHHLYFGVYCKLFSKMFD